MIIDGRQKKLKKWMETIITTLGWSYILSFLMQIVLSLALWYFHIYSFRIELFHTGSIWDTIRVVTITLLAAFAVFFSVYVWGIYNLKKFGPLKRRKFASRVTDEEMAAFFQLPVQQVNRFKQEKWIDFEETIV